MDYAWFLFSFKGRINRASYLAVQLALLTFWFIFFIYFSPQWKDLHFDWTLFRRRYFNRQGIAPQASLRAHPRQDHSINELLRGLRPNQNRSIATNVADPAELFRRAGVFAHGLRLVPVPL